MPWGQSRGLRRYVPECSDGVREDFCSFQGISILEAGPGRLEVCLDDLFQCWLPGLGHGVFPGVRILSVQLLTVRADGGHGVVHGPVAVRNGPSCLEILFNSLQLSEWLCHMADYPEGCEGDVLRCLFHSGVHVGCSSLSASLDVISRCLRGSTVGVVPLAALYVLLQACARAFIVQEFFYSPLNPFIVQSRYVGVVKLVRRE